MALSQDIIQKDISIQKTFIESLYKDSRTLVTGWFAQVACCAIGYAEFGSPYFGAFAVAMTIVLFFRMFDAKSFATSIPGKPVSAVDEAEMMKWENRYILGSCSTAICVSFETAYSVFLNPTGVSTIASLGLVLGTLPSVVGRNYALKRNLNYILILLSAPVLLGFVLSGFKEYLQTGASTHAILLICSGTMLIPAVFVTYKMSLNVREILFKSIFNFHEAENIRKLLRAALDHMPSGMIMINDDHQITLMNLKAAKMFGIDDATKVIDARVTLSRLVSMAVQSELVSREEGRRLNRQISDMMGSSKSSHVLKIGEAYIQLSVNTLPRRSVGDYHSISGAVLICENVTERVESERKSQYHANYDSLSDMPNRRYINEQVNAAVGGMKNDDMIAIAVLDIDGFKSINDNHGHAMGDAAIRAVAQELKNFNHPNVLAGRLGGDEFILAFHGLKSADRVNELFDSVFASLGKSYPITIEVKDARSKTNRTVSKSIDIRCSGGVIVRSKTEFKLEDALNKADIALRNAKQDRKQSWQLFDFDMESEHMRDERLRQDFRTSLLNGEISVVYQPMFTPDGKKIVACEALARWNHPKYGFISPAKFVPLAEQNGYINDLTRHILRRSCIDCAAWSDPSVSVSVNLSAIDLANRDIANDIATALREAKLEPGRLQVEVTESVFLKDREQAANILEELRVMGVKTAIDDFGTGYSNLAYLRDLPLDKLKIDRTFVNNIDQDKKAVHFFNTLVGFTKALGYGVVVEGVETIEQLEIIKLAEVDLIQGYLFGKPMSVSDIQQKIASLTEKHNPRPSKVVQFTNKQA